MQHMLGSHGHAATASQKPGVRVLRAMQRAPAQINRKPNRSPHNRQVPAAGAGCALVLAVHTGKGQALDKPAACCTPIPVPVLSVPASYRPCRRLQQAEPESGPGAILRPFV